MTELIDNECEYCHTKFSTNISLNRHKKTAKYCLSIRQDDHISLKYNCNYCRYTTGSKQSFNRHEAVCKMKIKADKILVQEQKEEIIGLKAELKCTREFAHKPKNNITISNSNLTWANKMNYMQNMLQPMADILTDLPNKITEKLTDKYISQGQKGVAQIVADIIKPFYKSLDKSGNSFFFKLEEGGKVCTDNNAAILISQISEPILKKTKQTIQQKSNFNDISDRFETKNFFEFNKAAENVRAIPEDSKQFRTNLAEHVYISPNYIKTDSNDEKIQSMIEKAKPKIFRIYFNEFLIKRTLSKLTEEEIELLDNSHSIANYIVRKFLTVDSNLIYNYNKDENVFWYFEDTNGDEITKIKENDLSALTPFWNVYKRILSCPRYERISENIKEIQPEEFREALIKRLKTFR